MTTKSVCRKLFCIAFLFFATKELNNLIAHCLAKNVKFQGMKFHQLLKGLFFCDIMAFVFEISKGKRNEISSL